MHREGHIGAALLAYAPLLAVFTAIGLDEFAFAGGVVVTALATLPDVDTRLPFVPHRGPTHTLRFAGAVAVVLGIVGFVIGTATGVLTAVGLGVAGALAGFIAIGSHIAVDALTPMGVTPFIGGPHYSYDVVRSANPLANYAFLLLGVGAVALAFMLGSLIAGLTV